MAKICIGFSFLLEQEKNTPYARIFRGTNLQNLLIMKYTRSLFRSSGQRKKLAAQWDINTVNKLFLAVFQTDNCLKTGTMFYVWLIHHTRMSSCKIVPNRQEYHSSLSEACHKPVTGSLSNLKYMFITIPYITNYDFSNFCRRPYWKNIVFL